MEEDRKKQEEIARQKAIREAEIKRQKEIMMRRENVTLKNQRKRNLEILKVHFDKFKEFHERKQQIKKFVNA